MSLSGQDALWVIYMRLVLKRRKDAWNKERWYLWFCSIDFGFLSVVSPTVSEGCNAPTVDITHNATVTFTPDIWWFCSCFWASADTKTHTITSTKPSGLIINHSKTNFLLLGEISWLFQIEFPVSLSPCSWIKGFINKWVWLWMEPRTLNMDSRPLLFQTETKLPLLF